MTALAYRSVEGLDVAVDSGVLHLKLARPEKRNAIDDTMMAGLIAAVALAGEDDRVRVVLLEGAGDHFCGGADIVARNADPATRPRVGSIQRRVPNQAHRLIGLLVSVQVPVVCRVRGWAAGIGFQLALASDFAVADEAATFWEPFVERGFTPDSGATWLLPRRVGEVHARELLMLGRKLDGAEAAAWGAIHRACPSAALDAEVDELVGRLVSGPTIALGLCKWLLQSGSAVGLDQQMASEAFGLELSSRSEDFREGLAAFKARRGPEFTGR